MYSQIRKWCIIQFPIPYSSNSPITLIDYSVITNISGLKFQTYRGIPTKTQLVAEFSQRYLTICSHYFLNVNEHFPRSLDRLHGFHKFSFNLCAESRMADETFFERLQRV